MNASSSGKSMAFCGDGDDLAAGVAVTDEKAFDFVAARGFRGIATLDACLSDWNAKIGVNENLIVGEMCLDGIWFESRLIHINAIVRYQTLKYLISFRKIP
ncbi:unnamed protein product [Clonostachys solani]|uniref:Uncharacterized protein n=1 Tax=Clonostachys solani TaxID=160281 RepID=A0A9N9ZFJ6_9HYPO|nr:unnamed protein product [Clonostachys solani]